MARAFSLLAVGFISIAVLLPAIYAAILLCLGIAWGLGLGVRHFSEPMSLEEPRFFRVLMSAGAATILSCGFFSLAFVLFNLAPNWPVGPFIGLAGLLLPVIAGLYEFFRKPERIRGVPRPASKLQAGFVRIWKHGLLNSRD